MIAIHIATTNDTNGNPRRLFLVVDDQAEIVDVVEEGYRGAAALTQHGYANMPITERINVTPAAYKQFKKHPRAR